MMVQSVLWRPKTMQNGWPTGSMKTRKPVSRLPGIRVAPSGSQLAEAGPGTGDYPAVNVLIDSHPQHQAVELRESTRVGAVDYCFLEASDHTESISAC
jgi:hypothetical protein